MAHARRSRENSQRAGDKGRVAGGWLGGFLAAWGLAASRNLAEHFSIHYPAAAIALSCRQIQQQRLNPGQDGRCHQGSQQIHSSEICSTVENCGSETMASNNAMGSSFEL
jgi:hypothetical protein